MDAVEFERLLANYNVLRNSDWRHEEPGELFNRLTEDPRAPSRVPETTVIDASSVSSSNLHDIIVAGLEMQGLSKDQAAKQSDKLHQNIESNIHKMSLDDIERLACQFLGNKQ